MPIVSIVESRVIERMFYALVFADTLPKVSGLLGVRSKGDEFDGVF